MKNPREKQIFSILLQSTVNQSTKTKKGCKQKFYAFEYLFVSLIIQIMSLSLVADYESSSSESESESAEIRFDFNSPI